MCGWAVSAGAVGGAGSQGEKLGFILSADSRILLEMNGIVFFPHLLSFCDWEGGSVFFLRNTFVGSQNWKEGLAPTGLDPFTHCCTYFLAAVGASLCQEQQTLAGDAWEVTVLLPSPRGPLTESGG